MRRFSQRSSLVTLSEINITPLLDLAFVLLIIFVITTPLLENSLDMKLPAGGTPLQPALEKDFRTLEVDPRLGYVYEGRQMSLAQVEALLVQEQRANPNLVLRIRGNRAVAWDPIFQAADVCANHGIKVSFMAEPRPTR